MNCISAPLCDHRRFKGCPYLPKSRSRSVQTPENCLGAMQPSPRIRKTGTDRQRRAGRCSVKLVARAARLGHSQTAPRRHGGLRRGIIGVSQRFWLGLVLFVIISIVCIVLAGRTLSRQAPGGSVAGTGATSAASPSLVSARGQEKSSARPGGATIASPSLSTRVASGSAGRSAGGPAAPKRSPPLSPIALRGTTGPTGGGATVVPFAGACSSGLGNATGRT